MEIAKNAGVEAGFRTSHQVTGMLRAVSAALNPGERAVGAFAGMALAVNTACRHVD